MANSPARKASTARKASAARPAAARDSARSADTPRKTAHGTAVIKFDKTFHGGRVRGAVNGQQFDFPVDTEVTVTAAQLEALNNSGARFSTVTPLAGEGADEGSSASSTVESTATRLEPPTQPQVDEDGKPLDPPVLQQTTDKDFLENAQKVNLEEAAKAAGGRGPAEKKAAEGKADGSKPAQPAA